ncbi:MAG: hypothetical protein JW703_01125 [Candidatus Diapherotrites archaeon]|nr:hypothetical protein [Candidatus Diapherotrites archaeon]
MESKSDSWLEKVKDFVSKNISQFVAIMFLIFSIGMAYGVYITMRTPNHEMLYLAAPPLMGILAYYNRDIALILFVVFVAFFIIL